MTNITITSLAGEYQRCSFLALLHRWGDNDVTEVKITHVEN